MNLYCQETWLSPEDNCMLGESGVYETFTDSRGELFRALQKEYGRCVSKVYIGDGVPIGWVFQQRTKYSDSNDTFLRETWVTIHDAPPTKTTEYHYA